MAELRTGGEWVVEALRAEGVCEEIAPGGFEGDWLGPDPGDDPT